MRVAITGATGHIGANLVRQMLEQGIAVRALVRRNLKPLEGLVIEQVQGDLLDEATLESLLENVDAVIHAAGKVGIGRANHAQIHQINVEGTRLLLKVAKKQKVKRLVFLSSVHAYLQSPVQEVLHENRALVGAGEGIPYDRTKAEAQKMVLQANGNGLETIVLNPSGVLGPWDFGPSLMGRALLRFFQGKMPMNIQGGFDFVDVRDVSAAIIAALSRGRVGEAYLLPGKYYSMPELGQVVQSATGVPAPRLNAPVWLAHLGLPFVWAAAKISGNHQLYNQEYLKIIREGNQKISAEKAKKELGYSIRPLAETVSDTYHWFLEHGYLKN